MITGEELIKYSTIISSALEGEEILFSTPFDISKTGEYTDGFFAISKSKLCVVENGALSLAEKLSGIEKAWCAEYTGGGAIEVQSENGRQQILRFSMKYIEAFNAVCEIINENVQGNAGNVKSAQLEEAVCPVCGRPFIKDTRICPKCTDKLSVVKRIWKIAKPCRHLYLILLILFFVSGAVTVLNPFLSRRLVNDVLSIKNASVKTLIVIVGLMLLLSIVGVLISVLRDIVSVKASNLLVMDLRNHIYEKLHKMPLSYIEEKKTGDLIQRINNDTVRIQIFVQDIAIMAVNEICLFIAICAITLYLDSVMALLIFLPMPLGMYLIGKIRLSIQRRYRKQWRLMDKLTNRLSEVLNGIKVVKVFGREDDEINRFKETAGVIRELTCNNEKYVYTIFPIIKFIMGFGSYFVLLYGGNKVLGGDMSVGELVQFSSYGSYLYSKLEWFSMLPRHFTMALVSSQRVFEVLDENIEEEKSTNADITNAEGSFFFDDVSFGYKSYRKVLRNIEESVKKGEMIGLVGHSGAGKSTMINLIMRLYCPDSGKIMLDGEDIQSYNQHDYKSLLGVVLQESYLFSGSVLDNIRYGAQSATIEECIVAAKKANAHDFIMQLPDGYDTYVGEKGHKLSGGERQRISIARAIAANPKIIILDEATASVDTETELKIQEALSNVTKGKTVFAIAHRLSTLRNADRIFVLEEGRIAETGTHQELVEKNGIYAALLKAQREMARANTTIDNTDKEIDEKEIESEEFENE